MGRGLSWGCGMQEAGSELRGREYRTGEAGLSWGRMEAGRQGLSYMGGA